MSSDVTLITGGAGFVGTNVAKRLLQSGREVLLFDNLARAGVERNVQYLKKLCPERLRIEVADVRDAEALKRAVAQAGQVFHLAAQVAVTTSLSNPVEDFEVNARGTLNLLEALRSQACPPPLVYTSTNKVYGGLEDVALRLCGRRYQPENDRLREAGIGEDRPLNFHSPYGCSKGTADQYVLDYARTFGIPAVVFRMSCIYGPHQCGNEDQGWVAHFLRNALTGLPITVFGDGCQVRDALYVEDLVDALLLSQSHMGLLRGQAFNIGGGPANTLSLLELLEQIAGLQGGRTPETYFANWRPGDQRYYVSDTTKITRATGWQPRCGVELGVRKLYEWLCEHSPLEDLRPVPIADLADMGSIPLREPLPVMSRQPLVLPERTRL